MPSPLELYLLDALPLAVMVANDALDVTYSNKTAQDFFGENTIVEPTLLELCKRVLVNGQSLISHDCVFKAHRAIVHITLHNEDALLITIDLQSSAHRQTASEWKKESTRAAGVMAAMLAHEVKNPLSSIRGAAQLLSQHASESEKPLADLICSETLRIRDLLDQMEVFSDERSPMLAELNIHEALQYAMQVAKAGFAAHIKFIENYDPSLPLVLAQRELLVQLFLNLIKNAAEAMEGQDNATITLSTLYQSGYRLQRTRDKSTLALPVNVHISDNGPGIPSHIRDHLFEPFISSKEQGRGLGLAVVAKIAADLGVVVELDERQEVGTGFAVHLPLA